MKKYKILLIDDEPNILSALERALRSDQREIFKAADEEEAVKYIEDNIFNLVICDYDLGGTDGVDLLEKITAERPDIVPILLTGHADVRVVAEAVNRLSLQGFIVKPWDDDDLEAAVQNALKQRGLRCLRNLKAGGIMSKFAITVHKESSLAEAAHLMMRFNISGLPVLEDGGGIVGIIAASDLFRLMGEVAADSGDVSSVKRVCDVMTKEVSVVTSETPFFDLVKIMYLKNVHTMPVVDQGEIIGVVGRRDVFHQFYKQIDESNR